MVILVTSNFCCGWGLWLVFKCVLNWIILILRKIEIDFEDMEDMSDMECEGLEGILIDWQGGFIGGVLPAAGQDLDLKMTVCVAGSVSNDLMWLIPPFIEANGENTGKKTTKAGG